MRSAIIIASVLLVCSFDVRAQWLDNYESLFIGLLMEAPDNLNIDELKSYPKFRNIHHDGFDRLPDKPCDDLGAKLEYYTIANTSNIGKNSYQNRNEYAYQMLNSNGADFDVGVKKQKGGFVAFNNVNFHKRQLRFLNINTLTQDYGILVKKGTTFFADAKVAFRIEDVNNFYYARLKENKLLLYRVHNGKVHKVKRYKTRGELSMYLLLMGDRIYIYADRKYKGCCDLMSNSSTVCGLFFKGSELSEIDDFVVERMDSWNDNPIDSFIETGDIAPKQFGSWQTEDGLITASTKHTNGSKYSLRFELDYYDKWEPHKISNKRRTEICPKAIKSAPLDSWISSFDIYFPGLNDGDEYYKKDSLSELFWQSHDRDAAFGLSPHVAFYLKNDIITFQTLSRSILQYDKEMVSSNKTYNRDGRIGTLVDVLSNSSKDLQLKRGDWHNFTIYIKEGYTEAQLPRTIVYVDGKKVIDWFHPNAYNCGQNAEYLKMGIYKWPWAQDNLKTDVRERVLYYDNIIYLR